MVKTPAVLPLMLFELGLSKTEHLVPGLFFCRKTEGEIKDIE